MSKATLRVDPHRTGEGAASEPDTAPAMVPVHPGEIMQHAPTFAGDDLARPRRFVGFARMNRKRVREIARKGGRAAHAAGTAHEYTPEEARVAGRKGGTAARLRRDEERAKQSLPAETIVSPRRDS